MKTKHLFFATALVASFASCTNDDIIEVQQAVNTERPTVDNVQLNFVGEGAESRLVFGADGYAWEADDVIGALNMDQPKNSTVWSSKYIFENNINTSYPFSYDAATGAWGTPGKMLEGNYFFAFPFTDYEGERYAKYSLINQQQNGVKGAVVAENYAKNQVFLGYTPIKKGTGFDILTDIEMTSLLGAIQFRLLNESDKTLHINKIIVRGTGLYAGFQLDPTNVEHAYADANKDFVAVNYLGKDFGGDKVADADVKADIEKGKFKENRMEYLRKVANYAGENYVQLFVNGTEEERAVAKGATAYALVMANPVEYFTYNATAGQYVATATTNTLQVEIYTNEGRIVKDLLADQLVISTKPGVANTVKLSIKDADVKELNSLNVYTSEDLKQLIGWNISANLAKPINATLMTKDVVLTKEAFELLKSNDKLNLTISGTEALTIAEDVPADVLEYKNLTIAAPVKVEGTINFTKKSKKVSSITALEGAVLNIAENSAEIPATVTINKGAELTMVENATVSGSVTFTNNGTMTVAKGGNILGTINNNGTLTINGKVQKLVNTTKATLGANAVIASGKNNGSADANAYIVTSSTAKVTITDNTNGRVKYVAGATIAATGGYVYDELTTATISDETYKNKGVNLFILNGGEITISKNVTLANVEVAEGAVAAINVAKAASTTDTDKTLTISSNLNIKKNATLTTNGAKIIMNGTTTIAKDAEWTNNATVEFNKAISNNGVVYNHATMKETAANLAHTGTTFDSANWKITALTPYAAPAITKQDVMDAAVKAWLTSREASDLTAGTTYNGNPYSVEEFVSIMNAWKSVASRKAIVDAFEAKWVYAYSASNTTKAELVDEDGVVAEEFTTAVNKVLDVVAAKVKALVIDSKTGMIKIDNVIGERNMTLWKTQKDAFDNFRYALAKNASLIAKVADIKNSAKTDYYVADAKDWTPECIAAAAWRLTDEVLAAAMAKTEAYLDVDNTAAGKAKLTYFYIWEGCQLDEVMDVYNRYASAASWSAVTKMSELVTWMNTIVASESNSVAVKAAKVVVEKYYDVVEGWAYANGQVTAAGKKGTTKFQD